MDQEYINFKIQNPEKSVILSEAKDLGAGRGFRA
jgi:hypothetical protein